MTGDLLMILYRMLILLPGLAGIYFLLSSQNLIRKTLGWTVFQISAIFLWLTTISINGIGNPLSPALIFSIFLFSFGILIVVSVLLIGVARQYGTVKEKEINQKESA